MNLLLLVQNVCKRVGIASPTTVSGSSDQQIIQLLSLANEEGEEHSERYPWSSLHREATFTTAAVELQGAITSIASDGFRYIVNGTIWNRTQQRPIYGSLSPQNWQLLKSSNITGPFQEYRIRSGNLYFLPTPVAGEDCAFEYITKNWCQSSLGVPQSAFTADADVPILDESLMISGLVWRWKRTKGLEYAEDFRLYETRITNAMGRDEGKPVLSMDGSPTNRLPGIFVPEGNWNL